MTSFYAGAVYAHGRWSPGNGEGPIFVTTSGPSAPASSEPTGGGLPSSSRSE